MPRAIAALLTLLVSNVIASPYVEYLIVGAGPAGLQLGAFLASKGRDYHIIERNDEPCSFYRTYPRHGQLLSLNKRYTGSSDPDFNLRHDWNSLLPLDVYNASGSPLFRDFSTKTYPTKEDMLTYCAAFNAHHNLKIKWNTTIVRVSRPRKTDKNFGAVERNFTVHTQVGRKIRCKMLIWATGRSPYMPYIEGIEHAIGYDDPAFVTDPEYYANKRVLILGLGNSAFETAASMKDTAASVKLIGRSTGGLRFAFNTHYPGDIRAVNSHTVDSFLLSSLDTIDTGIELQDCWLEKNTTSGQIRLRFKDNRVNYNYREPYDVVIRALGWQFNLGPFDANVRPQTVSGDKFPDVTADYESKNVANLFFAGTLMHGHDYRRSAGGFVHGFRYLVRSLSRFLDVTRHGGTFFNDNSTIKPTSPATIAAAFHKRMQTSSGLYQMFGTLCDLVVWDQLFEDGTQADYVEERPCLGITEQVSHPRTPMFSMTFDYGHALNGQADNSIVTLYPGRAQQSQFLHPVFRFYLPEELVGEEQYSKFKQLSEFHIMEDSLGSWDVASLHRKPLEDWIERCLAGNYVTQDELLETWAQNAYTELTPEQKRTGYTVSDPFYGVFKFPSEEQMARMNLVASQQTNSAAGSASALSAQKTDL